MSLTKTDIAEAIGEIDNSTVQIGQPLFIRTVTFHAIGVVSRLSSLGNNIFMHLEQVTMVFNTPEIKKFLKGQKDTQETLEDTARLVINVGAIVDFIPWDAPLPKE